MAGEIMNKEEEGRFGKGLCYNLGLFLAHAEREIYKPTKIHTELHITRQWFDGANDHLIELQIEQAPKHLRKRLNELRNKCGRWAHYNIFMDKDDDAPTKESVQWAIKEAKYLLFEIDKANGIDVIIAKLD